MKKIGVTLLLTLFIVIAAACSNSLNSKIVGSWHITDVEDKKTQTTYFTEKIREHRLNRHFPKGTVIEFMKDGLVQAAGQRTNYDFPAKGKLRLISEDVNGDEFTVDLTIEEDQMVWDYGDVVVTFERLDTDNKNE